MPPKIKDITHYQRKISVYNKRRERHKKIASSILYKIRLCKDQIRRIKKRDDKIKHIIKSIENYYGLSPHKDATMLALFFKYGMENGISGRFLRDHLNIENHRTPGLQRNIFTKLIQKDKATKEQYHNFLKHMKSSCK